MDEQEYLTKFNLGQIKALIVAKSKEFHTRLKPTEKQELMQEIRKAIIYSVELYIKNKEEISKEI